MTGADTPAASDPTSSVPRPRGLVLSPFRALRYDTALAGDLATLTSPPYDVLDADGVAALEATSENNIVRLNLPRSTAQDGQVTDDRYDQAARTLAGWRTAGVLRPDPTPALYVYEQAAPGGGHVQRGLVGALGLSPADDGIVLPHENTMSGPVADRLSLYTAVRADLEPSFLLDDGGGAATPVVAGVGSGSGDAHAGSGGGPLVDAVLGDGLRHRLWPVTDGEALGAIADDLMARTALIADGHHRYATYLQRQAEAHAAGHGRGPWDFGLCLLVDAGSFGPEVHPIHRVVPGRLPAELAERARGGMTVQPIDDSLDDGLAALAQAGSSGPAFLLCDGEGSALQLLTAPEPVALAATLPETGSSPRARLDVTVLHVFVVARLWQLPDDEQHLGYAHNVGEAVAAAARSGGSAVLLNPTPREAVAEVAAAGERMPRKSTLFTPKPRTGVLLRDYRDA